MLKKLPRFNEVLPVFAVVTALTYGWTLVAFLWKLPSWFHYLTPGEILAIYSYSLLTDFSESILFLALLLFLCLVLPTRWMQDVFILRGTVFALCILGGMMFLLGFYINNEAGLIGTLPAWLVILACTFVILVLLDFLSRRFRLVSSALTELADRLTIFLYVNLTLSVVALVIVAFRNLG
jgi:hypothetical protein